MLKFIPESDRKMANGMRNSSKNPLTDAEIAFVKKEISRIEADETVFIFNDERHLLKGDGTGYNYEKDKVFVTKNVLPDMECGSIHPRDIMSVAAVLAHEYYGHRPYRQEYLDDENEYDTTPYWEDECRASITAAKITPNLTKEERRDLIMDAVYRAHECGQMIEMDDYMKEVVYGYGDNERGIGKFPIEPIRYISRESMDGISERWEDNSGMSKMREDSDGEPDR